MHVYPFLFFSNLKLKIGFIPDLNFVLVGPNQFHWAVTDVSSKSFHDRRRFCQFVFIHVMQLHQGVISVWSIFRPLNSLKILKSSGANLVISELSFR